MHDLASSSLALARIRLAPLAGAQCYPSAAVRLVVAFPPGGSTDLAARALGEKLPRRSASPSWSRTSPAPAATSAPSGRARAPDGYTLLMAATSFAAAPGVLRQAVAGTR